MDIFLTKYFLCAFICFLFLTKKEGTTEPAAFLVAVFTWMLIPLLIIINISLFYYQKTKLKWIERKWLWIAIVISFESAMKVNRFSVNRKPIKRKGYGK